MSIAAEEIVRSRPVFTTIPLARILAGQSHVPVVYFAHMGPIRGGEVVKIGTSKNLKARMDNFYVPLSNVLAVVPGDREVETAYHHLFAEYRVSYKMREMFRLEGRLKRFLSSQADGTTEYLPPCMPSLVKPAEPEVGAAGQAHLAPVVDSAGALSLLEIVRRYLLPNANREEQRRFTQMLRQDRYRSDKGELPRDLVFPEPARVAEDGRRTELFKASSVIEFNCARRKWRI